LILGRGLYGSAKQIHLPRSFMILRLSFPHGGIDRHYLQLSAIPHANVTIFSDLVSFVLDKGISEGGLGGESAIQAV